MGDLLLKRKSKVRKIVIVSVTYGSPLVYANVTE